MAASRVAAAEGAQAPTQWSLKVQIGVLEQGLFTSKSKWEAGDKLSLSIEPHATINMCKQRIALIVSAHPKHQSLSFEGQELDDEILKLQDIAGLQDGGTLTVDIKVPPEAEVPPVEISDDEGLFTGEEEVEAPALPAQDVLTKELDDAAMDQQGELKQQAQEAIEDGDLDTAVAKMTEAISLGNVSAMMLAKRADLLIKQKRYNATIVDATAALSLNPDSAKSYRLRGKARRFLGAYADSSKDLSEAQRIDYDDGVADMHKWVQTRCEKMALKAKQEAKQEA